MSRGRQRKSVIVSRPTTPSPSSALSTSTESLIATLIPGTSKDHLLLPHLKNWALRELRNDTQGSIRKEWEDVRKNLDGLTHTAKIRVQGDLADALEKVTEGLEGNRRVGGREWDEGFPITVSNLAQHVQLLLNLSNPPNETTHTFAELYLSRQLLSGSTSDQILYSEIMAPTFEGDHWGKGYDEEVVDGWSDSDSPQDFTSDSEDDQVWTPNTDRIKRFGIVNRSNNLEERQRLEGEERMREARAILERLGERAYWVQPSVELECVKEGVFGWKEMSTMVDTLALAHVDDASPQRVKLVTARQLQREMLFALSGQPNLFLKFHSDSPYCSIIPGHPQTLHYSPPALEGILTRLVTRCAQLSQLRSKIAPELHEAISKTYQAFIEGLRSMLRKIAKWISELETTLIQGVEPSDTSNHSAATPSALLLALDTQYGDLLDYLISSLPSTDTSMDLLDVLYDNIASSTLCSSRTIEISSTLFIETATPIWKLLGRWLNYGMPLPSALLDEDNLGTEDLDDEPSFDPEFFIKRDKDVSWLDEDFWECAWIAEEWPDWIPVEMKEKVIEAGKARGLLRGLKRDLGKTEWKSLSDLKRSDVAIESAVQEYLNPICDSAIFEMRMVLEDECGLMAHLDAIEGTIYMREFGVIDDWSEWLYSQIQGSKRTWADFHTLSNKYRESITSNGEIWMNAPAIRLSLSSRLKEEIGTSAIGLIRVDYQVPFPLSQLFSPTSMELRSNVFTFLLQLGHGRKLLHCINSAALRRKGRHGNGIQGPISKILSLRQQLLWSLDTIWIWLHDRVIGPQTSEYRQELNETKSLGSMIQLELSHVRSIRKYSFLHDSTSVINGCVHDMLELSQILSDLAGSIMPDPAPLSVKTETPAKSNVTGRSKRRLRRIRRRPDTPNSSDEENEIVPNVMKEEEVTISRTMDDISPEKTLEKIGNRLKEVVQVFRDGVEDLSVGDHTDEGERDVWGMLDFALQDWRGEKSE